MADDNFRYVGIHEKTPVPALKKRNTILNKAKAVAKSTTVLEVKHPQPWPRPLCCTYAVENLANFEGSASHGGGKSGEETDQIDQHRKRQKVIDRGSAAELIEGDVVMTLMLRATGNRH